MSERIEEKSCDITFACAGVNKNTDCQAAVAIRGACHCGAVPETLHWQTHTGNTHTT